MTFPIAVLAFVVGGLLAWTFASARLAAVVRRADRLSAELDAERRTSSMRGDLALQQQEVSHLVAPLRDTLTRVEGQLHGLESARRSAYDVLTEQVRSLALTHDRLRDETRGLADALKAPNVRGQWGEMQLRRVVELAGMLSHCDFTEQQTSTGPGGTLRPDLVVRLPGGRSVVVDSKVPLAAYLEAAQTSDPSLRQLKLREHAKRVRAHIDALAAKAYWQRFSPSPDYVVLFVPGEALLADALDQDPTLLEYGIDKGVVLSSPTSLIMLLKAVAVGWREESLAESAQEVCELGKELYERLSTLGAHMSGVGLQLDKAVDSYNRAVGSLEGRVLVTARKFRDLQVTDADLLSPAQVERQTRMVQAPELIGQPSHPRPRIVSVASSESHVLLAAQRLPSRAELAC